MERDLATVAEMARLAEHVYFRETQIDLSGGWRLAEASGFSGTSFFCAVYVDAGNGTGGRRVAISFRGTDSMSDLSDNADVFLGKLPKQFSSAARFAARVCRKLGVSPQECIMTGHSLGGYLAEAVAEFLGARMVYTFNSPHPSAEVREALGERITAERLLYIRSDSDVASLWGHAKGDHLEFPATKPHNMRLLIDAIENDAAATAAADAGGGLQAVFNDALRRIAGADVVREQIRDFFRRPSGKNNPRF